MRKETWLIKNILQWKYPNNQFKLVYKTTNNYSDTSDKLIVTVCSKTTKLDDVVSLINQFVKGIVVYKYGEVRYASNIEPKIFQPNSEDVFEPDLLEFIEVRHEPKCFNPLEDNEYRCQGIGCNDGSVRKRCALCRHLDLKIGAKAENMDKKTDYIRGYVKGY